MIKVGAAILNKLKFGKLFPAVFLCTDRVNRSGAFRTYVI